MAAWFRGPGEIDLATWAKGLDTENQGEVGVGGCGMQYMIQ